MAIDLYDKKYGKIFMVAIFFAYANGAELIATLLQVCYAVSVGYLFVVIFQKSKSLIPCIIVHSLTNSLSIFNIDNTISLYVAPAFLIIVPLVYALYINKSTAGENCEVS